MGNVSKQLASPALFYIHLERNILAVFYLTLAVVEHHQLRLNRSCINKISLDLYKHILFLCVGIYIVYQITLKHIPETDQLMYQAMR